MKKIILFLLISAFCFSQTPILTIYKNGYPRTSEYTVPMTYHDSREVGPNIQAFCIEKLEMSLDEMDFYLKEDSVTYMKFTENGFNKKFEKLRVDMHMITVNTDVIYSKIIINGGYDIVTKFWAFFWNTTPKFELNLKTGLLAENRYLYDKIQLYKTKTGAKIIVTNTFYTPDKFWDYYDSIKNTPTIDEIKKDPLPKEEKPPVLTPSYNEANQYIQVHFSKNKQGISFNEFKIVNGDNVSFDIKTTLLEQINKDFSNDKNGNYTAFYDVFYINNEPKKIKLKTRLNR